MMRFDLGDLGRFALRVKRLTLFAGPPDDPVLVRAMADLLESWERLVEEGNRKGLLAGTDAAGHPAPPLKYRPKGGVRKLTVQQRLGQHPRLGRGKYYGGKTASLASTDYRHLDGPRDAPRKQFSRVITNAAMTHGRVQGERHIWFVQLAWVDIVSKKGYHFLPVLCTGNKTIPPYEIRGIRPPDVTKMREALQSWSKLLIRGHFDG
jgi:hypothetical protein